MANNIIQIKEIDDSIYIVDILRNISKATRIEASIIHAEDSIEPGYLVYSRAEKKMLFLFKSRFFEYAKGQELTISFLLKETVFTIRTMVLDIQEESLYIETPSVFQSSFKRIYTRYIPGSEENLRLELPNGNVCQIKDVNIMGVSFYCKETNLEINQMINGINIMFAGQTVKIDAQIKYIVEIDENNRFMGASFRNIDWYNSYPLYAYIFSMTYPDIRQITDFSKGQMYELYEQSNYFKLKPRKEIETAFGNMYNVMNQIKHFTNNVSNPVFVHNDKLYMGASVLRIYNRGFLAQHLAAIPESRLFPTSKTSVYLGLNDYLLFNNKFEYYITYFDATNKWHKKMYSSIAAYIDDESKCITDTVEYFECYLDSYQGGDSGSYRGELLDDLFEFSRFAEKSLPRVWRDSYGYGQDSIGMEEVKAEYRKMGLYADRAIIRVTEGGRLVAYGVCEAYTPGLNLYNVLDMIRFYVIDENCHLENMFKACINTAKSFFLSHDTRKFNVFINLEEGVKDTINIPGLRYDFLVGRVLATRLGIAEYRNLFLNMMR